MICVHIFIPTFRCWLWRYPLVKCDFSPKSRQHGRWQANGWHGVALPAGIWAWHQKCWLCTVCRYVALKSAWNPNMSQEMVHWLSLEENHRMDGLLMFLVSRWKSCPKFLFNTLFNLNFHGPHMSNVLQVGPTSDMVEKGPPIPQDWVGKQRCLDLLG